MESFFFIFSQASVGLFILLLVLPFLNLLYRKISVRRTPKMRNMPGSQRRDKLDKHTRIKRRVAYRRLASAGRIESDRQALQSAGSDPTTTNLLQKIVTFISYCYNNDHTSRQNPLLNY